MKIYMLYNRGTSAERVITSLDERLKRENVEAEIIDADSARGIQLTETYDILGRPAVIVASNEGSPVQVWQGEDMLPTPAELAYYGRQ